MLSNTTPWRYANFGTSGAGTGLAGASFGAAVFGGCLTGALWAARGMATKSPLTSGRIGRSRRMDCIYRRESVPLPTRVAVGPRTVTTACFITLSTCAIPTNLMYGELTEQQHP